MNIKSIKWNGKATATSHIGTITGSNYSCNEAIVSGYNNTEVLSIIEVSNVIYDIKYKDKRILRIFNPIELEYYEE